MINVESCPSSHLVFDHLQKHEKRIRELRQYWQRQMHVTGDELTLSFLEIGVLKRICEKVEPALNSVLATIQIQAGARGRDGSMSLKFKSKVDDLD